MAGRENAGGDLEVTIAEWTYETRHYEQMIALPKDELRAEIAAGDPDFDRILAATMADRDDIVVDVASGPGLMVSQFASHVKWVYGVDAVEAVTETGSRLCRQAGVTNASWLTCAVPPLDLPAGCADVVTCRLGLHHMTDPVGAIAEFWRVCAPGGRLLIIDQVRDPSPVKAARYDEWERQRDPSHQRLLSVSEIRDAMVSAGAELSSISFSQREGSLEFLLSETRHFIADPEVYSRQLRALQQDDILYQVWQDPDGWRFAALDAVVLARKPA